MTRSHFQKHDNSSYKYNPKIKKVIQSLKFSPYVFILSNLVVQLFFWELNRTPTVTSACLWKNMTEVRDNDYSLQESQYAIQPSTVKQREVMQSPNG